MKKILIIHPALAPYRIDFFNQLSNHFQVELVLLYENITDNPFDQESLRNQLHFPVEVSPAKRTFLNQRVPSGLDRKIIAFRPDIIICSEFSLVNNLVYLLRMIHHYRFKIVTITDDNAFRIAAPGSLLRKMNRALLCRLLDGIITLDIPEVKSFYQSKTGTGKTIGIHHLVRDSALLSSRLENLRVEKSPGLENVTERKTRFLFVGRLVYEKGVDILLMVFSRLVKLNENTELYIVGEGIEHQRLELMIRQMNLENSVFLFGRQEGSALLLTYLACDIFVLPSRYEPFGAVVNEALIAGLPVVCSDRVGAKCLIDEGINGSVFPSEDLDAFLSRLNHWASRVKQHDSPGGRKSLMKSTAKEEVEKLVPFLERLSMANT